MSELDKTINNIKQDMRRGTIVLAVLTQMEKPQYGYSLIESLDEKGFTIEQNTLYPLLRRLEKQGLLESVWEVTNNRPRRYYIISDAGRRVKKELIEEWKRTSQTFENLIYDRED
jgi:DNA-binding PadR family transcriptional regulator